MKMISLRGFVLLFLSLPVFAGGFQQFPLPRTAPLGVTDIAAADDYAWVAPEDAVVIVKVDLNGNVTESYDIYPNGGAQALALDPTDGGVWFAEPILVGVISGEGEYQEFDLPGFEQDIEDMIVGPDDHIWIAREDDLVRVSRTGQMQTFNVLATGLAAGPDGNIWYASEENRSVGKITPAGVITNYPQNVPGEFPVRITNGPGGKLWFTTSTGRVRDLTTSGVVTASINGGAVFDITTGDDGLLWWYDATPALKKYNTATSTVDATYPVNAAAAPLGPLSASAAGVWWGSELAYFGKVTYSGETLEKLFRPIAMSPGAITASATHLWFTAGEENQVGRMTPAGAVDAYDLPIEDSLPGDIVIGPDAAAWFVEVDGDRIGRIDDAGALTEFTIPVVGGEPTSIVTGFDNNLWFTLAEANKIVRLTPAGVFTQFSLPTAEAGPAELILGPDNNLWFVETDANRIGRITPAGVITEYNAVGSQPHALTVGPEGKLWYLTIQGARNITTAGVVTTLNFTYNADEQILGPDGALWAISNAFMSLQRITSDGQMNSWQLTDTAGGITLGPDGKIWITSVINRALTRIDPDLPMSAIGKQICMPTNGTVSGVIASFVDPNATAATYGATIKWGDVPGASVGTVVQTSPGHFDVTGTHTYDNSFIARTVLVTFYANQGTDRLGGSAVAETHINVVGVSPSNVNIMGIGETRELTITTPGCPWTATSNRTWITFPEGNTGNASGTLYFTVAENTSRNPRSGTINVNGYIVTVQQAASANPVGTNLYLITPCRLYDTRDSNFPLTGNLNTRTITAAGKCGIPQDAQAIAANITAVSPTNNGWLAAYEAGIPWPGVSTVSYRTGKTRANNAVVPLRDGALTIANGGTTVHFIVDVTGYFQ